MSVASVPLLRERPVRDTWHVFVRELRPVLRDPFSLIFSLLQPLVFLGLFGPLLVGSAGGPAADTLVWFVPGILVMTVLFGAGATGANLLFEAQTGSHERTLVAPIARSALLVGRALKEIAPIIVQSLLIVAVALPFGYRADPLGLIAGLALLAVFGIGLGSLSYALALASRKKDWMFWAVQQSLIFPLMILSGMLLPLDDGPAWMRSAASINPISHIVTAERTLLAGDLLTAEVLYGFAAALALAALGLTIGIRAMRRQS
ncbi:ABC-2 type transport system permease protein [Actinocorallia herbida]|uniref:Transport permease protein n=1 Tax=Actinocorallia herbida TaxID=58109 RepID=A0A3N1D829_9ACTN|nr:ABC transporter permease [Actinocorallia herbida]ROO89646.1 ABC-2 type transport system permease protein [Actinocorallia herbida]